MRFPIRAATTTPPDSGEQTSVIAPSMPQGTVTVEQKTTVSTTSAGLRKHITDLAISCAAVLVMAGLQGLLNYLSAQYPGLVTASSQLGAALAAVKLLGR